MAESQHTGSAAPTQAPHEERKSSLLSDILTIIGFAILFIIIIWGLVHLVELVAASFSPSKPAPTIHVTAPSEATSGQPVTVSWNYATSTAGSYVFVYQCEKGLLLQPGFATSTKETIPCGVAFTTASLSGSSGTSSSLTLIPLLSATSSMTDTLSIVFIPSNSASRVQGDATMTVVPAPKTATKPAPAKTSSTNSYSSTNYNYSGPADLAVSIISGNINANGYGTVTFNIANVGGSTSGSYTFSAQLPTAQPYPYQSPLQAPLAPGAHVVSTLNFTDAAPGGGLFSVSIQNGSDANVSNNYASMQITAPYNYNYQQPYVQYPTYNY